MVTRSAGSCQEQAGQSQLELQLPLAFNGHDFMSHGPVSPAAWYGGTGGGDSNSPPARTNGNNSSHHNNNGGNSSNSRTSTPTTTAPSDWSEATQTQPRGATCSWEWWPPDPPEEWALSNAPWEPPPAPGVNGYGQQPHNGPGHGHSRGHDSTNGHHVGHDRGTPSGVW